MCVGRCRVEREDALIGGQRIFQVARGLLNGAQILVDGRHIRVDFRSLPQGRRGGGKVAHALMGAAKVVEGFREIRLELRGDAVVVNCLSPVAPLHGDHSGEGLHIRPLGRLFDDLPADNRCLFQPPGVKVGVCFLFQLGDVHQGPSAGFGFRVSSSSTLLGQSFLSRRERERSASTLPPVWQRGQ